MRHVNVQLEANRNDAVSTAQVTLDSRRKCRTDLLPYRETGGTPRRTVQVRSHPRMSPIGMGATESSHSNGERKG